MHTSPIFELNKTMLWAIGSFIAVSQISIASFAVVVGMFGQGICPDETTNAVATYGLLIPAVTAFVAGFWHLYRLTHTTISETGVGQPIFRGQTQIDWNNVERVELGEGKVLTLYASSGKISVVTKAYRNPDEVLTFLFGKLSKHGKA